MERKIKPIVKKVKIGDSTSDFQYWQSRSISERLETLEAIRQEYIRWRYGSQQRLQRVFSIVKQA